MAQYKVMRGDSLIRAGVLRREVSMLAFCCVLDVMCEVEEDWGRVVVERAGRFKSTASDRN